MDHYCPKKKDFNAKVQGRKVLHYGKGRKL